ncbi:MAG TPA: amidohydrolase family protein [Bryobacteraceae bacterium]|nr:amidohydrolase family protein [Bryobacteraceae bacterium]
MAISIFANHAHVFPESVNPQGTIDRLRQLMDACGIEQAVCFAPFPAQVERGFDQNAWLAKELASRDRLVGFATVDIYRSDRQDQVRRIKEMGLRGIKMHPQVQEFDILCSEAMQIYQAAEAHGLFITFHSGVHHHRIEEYRVLKFDEVAWNFPNLRFSLEHVGGYHFFAEALAVIVNNIPFPPVPGRRCMVYGGLTSIFTPDYLRFWYMPPQRLKELVLQAGPEQLIFGLDFPYNLEENTKLGIETIMGLDLAEEKKALILGNNLREALGIPMIA